MTFAKGPRVLVVGAGIIGASIAYHLSERGAQVTVLDQGLPASGASGSSFGWINANFAETPEYYALRRKAIDAFRRLSDRLDLAGALRWTGCLWWEDEGDAFEAHFKTLQSLGYEAERVDAAQIASLEPELSDPPEAAILTRIEGAADGGQVTRHLLQEAAKLGAQIIPGCAVKRLVVSDERVSGVDTSIGHMSANQVVVAAGIGTTSLLSEVGVHLPVETKTGVILQTLPVDPVLRHMIMSPDVHAHQLSDGRVLVGEIFSGGAPSARLCEDPDGFSREILSRLVARVPSLRGLQLGQCRIGQRPVPVGGLPAIGAIPSVPNAYVAVTHSGVTLAALIGELVAKELLDGANYPQLDSFRPARFVES